MTSKIVSQIFPVMFQSLLKPHYALSLRSIIFDNMWRWYYFFIKGKVLLDIKINVELEERETFFSLPLKQFNVYILYINSWWKHYCSFNLSLFPSVSFDFCSIMPVYSRVICILFSFFISIEAKLACLAQIFIISIIVIDSLINYYITWKNECKSPFLFIYTDVHGCRHT